MGTAELSTVVAVFEDVDSARHAVKALEKAGFPPANIGIEDGNVESPGLAGALVNMGVPAEQANAYASARLARYPLVTASTPDRQDEAMGILRQFSGAVEGPWMATSEMPEATTIL
jgi:hypothetical protein